MCGGSGGITMARGVRTRLVVVMLVSGLALAGCQDDTPDGTDGSEEGHGGEGSDGQDATGDRFWRTAGGGEVPAFRVSLPEGSELTGEPRDEEDVCAAAPTWSSSQDDERRFTVSSFPVSRAIDESVNESPLNGRHPTYRTADDIPDRVVAGADRVTTALGEALLFTQTYTECTNVHRLPRAVRPHHTGRARRSRPPGPGVHLPHGEMSQDELRSLITDHLRAG